MANIVQLKRSSVANKIPEAANVAIGEPVVNLVDKVLYTKNASNAIIVIGAGTTSNIAEGVNLYFTNARSRLAVSQGSGVSYNNSTGVISANVTSVASRTGAIVLTNADISGLTTANVTELTNLYFTNARAISAVTGNLALKANVADLTTANVSELTNQYFTNARARLAVSQGSGVSYNDSTGVISANVTSVNGSTGAITGLATTSSNLSQFASTTSAQLASLISDETGSGALVFSTSPTLVTPILGTPQSGTLTNATGLPIVAGTTGTLSVARGGTGETTSTGTGAVVLASRLTTANVAEVTNLYFTNTRAVSAFIAGTNIVIESNGRISANASGGGAVTSVAGRTGAVVLTNADISGLTTANVVELTNLYFTVARANTAIDNHVTKTFIDNLNVDADTLDSIDSASFLRSDADDTASNVITFSNGLTTSNINFTSTSSNTTITSTMLDVGSGTLSFEGNSGQLFSITDSLTGTIFSVNDISGIPSIEVIDSGLIKLAEYTGNVVIGSNTDALGKLQVTGNVHVTGNVVATGFVGNISSANGLPIVAGTTGTLSVARGGTGQTSYTDGQLLIGNSSGNTLTKANLIAGAGVTITNGAGAITIAASGGSGTVTSVSGTGTVQGLSLSGTVTSSGSLTLGGSLSAVSLTTQVSGTLPVANGGTGETTSTGTGAVVLASRLTTANVAEVTNLYFTNTRAVSAVTGNLALKANVADLTTANVSELTNQYFTNARARLSVSQGSGVSYNNSTGVISANVTSVNGSTGAITGLAVTSANLSQFASTTSAQLALIISDETGSGSLVFATSPTLVTPILGTPQSGTLTNATGLPIDAGTTGTLPVARGGTGGTTSTGTGAVVLATSPTLVTPILGTPSSGTLTSCTGLPIVAGTTGTLSVARGGTGETTSTGTGAVVLATSPTLVTPILGTPQSGTLTNCSFPTLNQNTTGSAATLTTSRAINGVNFNGSAAITVPGNFADRTTNESGHAVFISTTATGDRSMFTNTNYRFNPSTAEVSATSFNSTSDLNKKKDIETIIDALDIVKHLRGVTYNWKDTDRPGIGVIAQEVELYLPQVVVESDNESKTVQYGNMVGLLIEAIKEQQKQIEQMKGSITILLDKIYTKGKGK